MLQTRTLGNVPLFTGLSEMELGWIERVSYERTIQPGELVCEEGQPGHQFFVIVEGTASVHRDGRELSRLSAGDFFGELALLDRGPRSASVRAESPMRLQVIDELDFSALIDEIPALAHKLLAALATRVRTAEARSLD